MPQDKTILSAYEIFLEKGIAGAVAILAIAALIWAVVKLLKAKDDRIQDQKLFTEALIKTNEGVTALTIEANKVSTIAASEAALNSAALKRAIDTVAAKTDELKTTVTQLRDEHIRLTASLNGPRGR